MKSVFEEQWKIWDEDQKFRAKKVVSECVEYTLKWKKDFNVVLYRWKSEFIKLFVKKIEEFVK
jgi:hypothetical protein